MKAILKKKDLSDHRKIFKTAQSSQKDINSTASVIISVSDFFMISGPGFKQKLPAKIIEWGTIKIHYNMWEHLIRDLNTICKDQEIAISYKDETFTFASFSIKSKDISYTKNTNVQLELPINPTPKMVVEFVLKQDSQQLKNAGLSDTARLIMHKLDQQIVKAAGNLKEYEITAEDIRRLVAKRFVVTDYDAFKSLLKNSNKEL